MLFMDAQEFSRAFHRGRLLVLILAVGTACVFLRDAGQGPWANGVSGITTTQAMDWAFSALLCWWLYRGGKFIAGCAIALYGIVFSCFMAAVVYWLLGLVFSAEPMHGLRGWQDQTAFLVAGGWALFSLWVLLISADARLYREAQRLAIRAQDAAAFDWPPPSRR